MSLQVLMNCSVFLIFASVEDVMSASAALFFFVWRRSIFLLLLLSLFEHWEVSNLFCLPPCRYPDHSYASIPRVVGSPVGFCLRNLRQCLIPKDHRNCPPLLVSASNVRLQARPRFRTL